jgi:putative nucleotidyltransferase with HDIG domain
MKKQILFVDDDCNILEGLQRMFRSRRAEWDIQCVMSGAEALEIMNEKAIDLIITDMRMPEMDGAELLHEVMKRHPSVIRMIFSGQADSEMTTKAVGVAHQFISKPCNPEILKSIIQRAINLKSLLLYSSLIDAISEMDTLPSVPALYIEMTKELQSPEPSIQKVGRIIERDPGMAVKILQIVNSAFFGLRRNISNPADAVFFLGLDRVQHLFLALHMFSKFSSSQNSSFSIQLLWDHSFSTAMLAKTIAEREEMSKEVVGDSFTAGLLHDIGKLMLACRLPDRHAEAVNIAQRDAIPLWLAEHQVLSVTHAEIGAYLLGLWGLPDSIVEAVAYHHRPMESGNTAFCALTAVHIADCQNCDHSYAEIAPPQPDIQYLSRLLRKTKIPARMAVADASA